MNGKINKKQPRIRLFTPTPQGSHAINRRSSTYGRLKRNKMNRKINKKQQNQSEEQWLELCAKVRMLGQECNDCAYGGQCAHNPAKCTRHLPACLSFEPVPADEKDAPCGDGNTPLSDINKSFVGKIRKNLLKLRDALRQHR